jgi:hypothetical protein
VTDTPNNDTLRHRLVALDPQATAPVDPITSLRAQELLEYAMSTDTSSTHTLSAESANSSTRRRMALVSAAAAVAVAGTTFALSRGGAVADHPSPPKKTTLSLGLPAPAGPSLGSCIMLTPETLRLSPIAFAGTVTAVDSSTVSVNVTHWYAGGTAQVVTLSASDNTAVSQEGQIAFNVGGNYLVAADRGTVSTCGLSGPSTPELKKIYDEAYPS